MLTIQDLHEAKWRYYRRVGSWMLLHYGVINGENTTTVLLDLQVALGTYVACSVGSNPEVVWASNDCTVKQAKRRAKAAFIELMRAQGVPEC